MEMRVCFAVCLLLHALFSLLLASRVGAISRDDFPADFIFGASTSAYQVEGAVAEDGRKPSIWDTFTHEGRNDDKSNADSAANQYHNYKDDVKLMHKVGLKAYRFSISWPRLIPDGRGPVNPKGLQYYNNLINELLSYGIEPHVTLYHFDLPQTLQDKYAGMISRRIIEDFTAYANVCFEEFGDRVKYWSTFNEPNIEAVAGYDIGTFPPARCSYPFGLNCSIGDSTREPYLVAHNILLSHAYAASLYKEKYQKKQSSWFRKKGDEEEPANFGLARVFKHEELKKATNSFTTELGIGGFGSVYLGTLRNGQTVAVKALHNNNPKRLEQFVTEVIVLSRLRHKNLVTLHGCTNPRDRELLLVYEYVPNSTVEDHLHGQRSDLTLAVRVQIAVETAEALVYLHDLDPPIIHRDVKTSNIMLDHGFHVKVGDLGMCRLLPWDTTQISTVPQGTMGYRDPEYDRTSILTVKSDVYSFGVLLVELISTKKAIDVNRAPDNIYLAGLALNMIINKKLDDFVDPKLGYNSDIHLNRVINSLAELAGKCLHSTGIMRPTMKQVLIELKLIDDELRQVGGLNAPVQELSDDSLIDDTSSIPLTSTSGITCLKQRFRAAVVVPLMIILCCLWYYMSYCKVKEEGGEYSGTSMMACLKQRLCASVMPLMLILCCLWYYRNYCTSRIMRLRKRFTDVVILPLVIILGCLWFYRSYCMDKKEGGKHSGTSRLTCLKQRFCAVVVVPLMLILYCLWYYMSYCKAKEEGGTSRITCLKQGFRATVVVPLMLILCCLWYYRNYRTSGITRLRERFTEVVVLPLILILCCLWFYRNYCMDKKEGGEHSGTRRISCLKQRFSAAIVVPLMLILCCLWYYMSYYLGQRGGR